MRKLYKCSFLLFFLLISCYGSRLSNETVSAIENEDDNLCMMEGVQFKYADTRFIYWKCRLRIIDQRIATQFDDYGYDALYKREFRRIRRIIKRRIKEQQDLIISNIRNSQEEKEHNYCIMMKNNYDGKRADKNDRYDYFECRERIAAIRKKNQDFVGLSNEEFFQRFLETEEVETRRKSTITISGACVRFAYDTNKLKECEANLKKGDVCIDDVRNKINQRIMDDKIFCTKVSLNKYPDSLSVFTATDSGMATLGPRIDKIDLIELRKEEYEKCYKDRTTRRVRYRDFLEFECNNNAKSQNN
jgi:hypothetical protein